MVVATRSRAQKKPVPKSNPMEAKASDATNPTPQNRAINVSGWGVACVFAASRVRTPATIAFMANLLVETDRTLPDRRFKSFSQSKKMVSRLFRG
jgi:hypothetical protein